MAIKAKNSQFKSKSIISSDSISSIIDALDSKVQFFSAGDVKICLVTEKLLGDKFRVRSCLCFDKLRRTRLAIWFHVFPVYLITVRHPE